MSTLVVGFDSAWTASNSGGIVGVYCRADGHIEELGLPQVVNYAEAEAIILEWQEGLAPHRTIVMLDQPTVVNNGEGQRPVENIVSSPVSLRGGGVQPANTSRADMFGVKAPVWPFLQRFGETANPHAPVAGSQVFETYPVLSLIAMGWTLPGGSSDRLPKYNPARRKTFSTADWQHVCVKASSGCREFGLDEIAVWIDRAGQANNPRKEIQDCLDACICLLVGLQYVIHGNCLMVGDLESGYMVIPANPDLQSELDIRCRNTGRNPADWVRRVPENGLANFTTEPAKESQGFQATLLPEAFNFLRSFRAKGRITVEKTAPVDYLTEISAALPKAVSVVCQIDEIKLREELLARGVPRKQLDAICRCLKVEEDFDIRDDGLPIHLRKDLPAYF